MLEMARQVFQTERRSRARRHTFLPAQLTGLTGPRDVYLLNLTAEGALGYGQLPGVAGIRSNLKVGDVAVTADIVWVRGSSFGLRFVSPLDDSAVDDLLERADKALPELSRAPSIQ